MKLRKRLYLYGAALIFVAGAASAVTFLPNETKPKEVSFKQTSAVVEPAPEETTRPAVIPSHKTKPQQATVQPENPPTTAEEQEPVELAVNSRDYAYEKTTKHKGNGFSFNWECFDQLIAESTGWTALDKQEVDERFDYVITHYSSTCAAYAKFKGGIGGSSGSY